jgi:N4-(beta-N-acetylglucosaminyl)-L-asparaginase
MKRRGFIKKSSLLGISIGIPSSFALDLNESKINLKKFPVVIATWEVKNATNKAWNLLKNGSSSLDAVEQGCMIEEADVNNQSVGMGGLPDRDGNVTLDACIMNSNGDCGSVVYLKNITHAISIARKIMEETPHVMLAGVGAEEFAYSLGYKKEALLTDKSRFDWLDWKKKSKYKPIINIENHDTIGMLAIDKNGDISGGCTTSGLAYKMSGRVGDSPIIGSGLFIDNEIGGAVATGLGEEVVKTVGSFLVVELMRNGYSPQKACEEAIKRIVLKKSNNFKDFQVGYIAINKSGETGSYSIHDGFSMTKYENNLNKIYKSDYYSN